MEYEGCGETIGHGEVCSKGWLCEPCRNKYEAANKIEQLRDALRWALPYVKNDERVNDIVCAALKEGE